MAFERFIQKEELPYEYTLADSVETAREVLRQNTFNVVLSDYMLGDGNAFDIFPDIMPTPMIFITGEGNELIAVKAIKEGAYDYIIKDHERNYLTLLPIAIDKALAHREAEENLARAEREKERLSLLLSKTHNAVVVTDKYGNIKWINDGFIKLTGYSSEEVFSATIDNVPQHERIGLPQDSYYFNKVLKKKEPISFESLNRKKNGEPYWALSTLTPTLTPAGEVEEIIGIYSDITQTKETEQELFDISSRLISLIDNLTVGVLFENESREIVHVNKTFCRIFELETHPGDLVGMQSDDLKDELKAKYLHPVEYMQRITDLENVKKPKLNEEIKLEDGRVLERSYIPVKLNEEFRGHLWIYNDITIRKKWEQEVLAAKTAAEQSSKAKEQFLANISHEIRTPMNAIMGMSELLVDTNPNQEQKDYIRNINFAAENLLTLINDILDLSKIEAGKINFEQINFNPSELFNGIIQSMSFKAREKDLDLLLEIDSELPKNLCGDPVRLNQVLSNLLSNALKFTEEGQIILKVSSQKKDDKHVALTLSVSDTGIGIPDNKLGVIFNAFEQANRDTTRRYGGTGLGLAIVKQLVELQGGKISVDSEVDKGTTFTLYMTFEVGDAQNLPLVSDQSKPDKNQLIGLNVLLAEDNQMNQLLVQKFVEKWGVNLDVANNGREAIEKLNEKTYDLVLMDVEMPELDGYEATKQIRLAKIETPILAMTAHAFKQVEDKCLAVGMNDYISKPVKPDKLYQKMVFLYEGEKIK